MHLAVPQVQYPVGIAAKVHVVRDDNHCDAVLSVQLEQYPHYHVAVPRVEIACPRDVQDRVSKVRFENARPNHGEAPNQTK